MSVHFLWRYFLEDDARFGVEVSGVRDVEQMVGRFKDDGGGRREGEGVNLFCGGGFGADGNFCLDLVVEGTLEGGGEGEGRGRRRRRRRGGRGRRIM